MSSQTKIKRQKTETTIIKDEKGNIITDTTLKG